MIQVRSLGSGHWLVSIDTALGTLALVLRDTANIGNLYVYLQQALIGRLVDDLLAMVAREVLAS